MDLDRIRIRKATPEDAQELLEIYAYYVTDTAISYEWDVPSVQEFEQRIRRTLRKHPYLVADSDGELLGYTYASDYVSRSAYDWSAEATIYLKNRFTRLGLGRRLYDMLCSILHYQHYTNLYACIASTDRKDDAYLTPNSLQFHAHMGFRTVGESINCAYKFDNWYSMVWMEKIIGTYEPVPSPVIPFSELTPEELSSLGVDLE